MVLGNFIGTNASGANLGNTVDGVLIENSASNNTIGGANTIGFNSAGIAMANVSGNVVQGNFIGTNANGDPLGNGDGVDVLSASNNTIGGAANEANTIGFNKYGIDITGSGAIGNVVQGNFIGTNASGADRGNTIDGVRIENSASNNTIGGANIIGFNPTAGILIGLIGSGATGNVVLGNFIGTNTSGANLGNGDGVLIENSASNNTIGGTNTIAFNSGPGVQVSGPTAKGNSILSNSIYSNAGGGIVLTGGANNNQAAPTLTAALSPGSTLVEGTLAVAAGASYLVQYFYNNPPSNQGKTLFGSQIVSPSPAATTVNLSFSTAAAVPPGATVTATATNQATGDTSEFSNAVVVVSPFVVSPFVVTNTNDSGIGSLRQAILNADREAGHTISFAIPGAGVHTISPLSALPTITDPVIIDGYTQPGASPNTLAVGNNAVLLVELNGANAGIGVTGLTIDAGSSTVRGLVINRFGGAGIQVDSNQNLIEGNFLGTDPTGTVSRGNTLDGIISLNDASNNRIIGNVVSGNGINQDAAGINLESNDRNNIIAGNEIGTNAAGNAMLGNSLHGIFLGNGSSNNTIGGPTDNDRNVISGNGTFPVTIRTSSSILSTRGGVGVYIYGANTSGNVVLNNYIGTNVEGTAALGNSVIGVLINQSPGNTVQDNVISGNRIIGVEIAGGTASGNLVQSSKIGTNAGGTAAIPNGSDGIFINNAPNNTIGGTAAGAGNRISGNVFFGIQLFGPLTSGNVIQGNITSGNRVGGILVMNTNRFANQLDGASPGRANQGRARPIFSLARRKIVVRTIGSR